MNMAAGPLVAMSTIPNVSRDELIAHLAEAVRRHPLKNLGGIERIEGFRFDELAELPTDSTVFGVMANELESMGIYTDNTVGGVMEALGYERGSDEAAKWAHEIGCYCHGDNISPDMASGRIMNLRSK